MARDYHAEYVRRVERARERAAAEGRPFRARHAVGHKPKPRGHYDWFGAGWIPILPLQAMYRYVREAFSKAERDPSHRAYYYSTIRQEAWDDYQWSLETNGAPEDSSYRLERQAFDEVWRMTLAAWGSTTPEMRRHEFNVQASAAWASNSRRELHAHKYAFQVIMVVQGRYDREDNTAHHARFVVGYDSVRHTVNQTVKRAADRAQEWRSTNSEIWVLCGNVTSIATNKKGKGK